MVEDIIKIAALVIACSMVVVWTWYWIKVLVEISRSDMDLGEKRKWWWRVFVLRLLGILWYHEHLKKTHKRSTGPVTR
ncbi:MAG: hypothetical protein JSU73_03805 [candidate division WOR-3 bacterium]|nr:MAG: hypothetical protein JSU73_03805 [candidate division WOR-3 bacterium]